MKKLILLMLALVMASFTFVYADTVQVGTGTSTSSYLPLYGLYGYNYTQQIYTQAQIGVAGNITKIRFYYVSGTITNSKDWVVYMGHTTKTTFATTTDWEPLANLTQVFAGDVTSLVPLANNWMEITLSTPFAYNNTDNLIVAVDENTAGYASMSWGAFTSGTNTGIYYYSDTINPDPAAPPTASSRTATIDRMQFFFPNSAAPLAPTLLTPANGGWSFLDGKLYWTPTAGGSDANTYDVYFGTSATPPLVSDNQVATNYTPTLAANTTYWWKVTAANEIGDSPASATWSFTTPSATQLAESFENTTFPPAGWANPGSWYRGTTYYKHGTAGAYKSGSTSSTYVLSTPRVTITPTSTLNFWAAGSSTTTSILQVVYSADRVTWTQIGSNITPTSTYTMVNYNIDLSSLAGNNYFLGFQNGSGAGTNYIDLVIGPDITPEVPGPVTLSTPADLAVNVVEYPTFTWTAPTTGGVPTGYAVYCSTSNPPNYTTDLIGSTGAGVLTFTATTALAYNTTYYWTVKAFNAAGDATMPTPRSFTTRANPTITTLPFTEGFETGNTDAQPVALWSSVYVTGTKNWTANSTATSYNRTPRTGSFNAFLGWSASTWMIRPVQLTGGTSYDVEVFARQDNADTALANMTIAYGTSGTAAGMTNIIVPQTGLTNGDYQRLIGSFIPASTGIYYIGILGTLPTSTNWYVSIDDITIRETPEGAPEAVTLNGPTDEAPSVSVMPTFTWTASVDGGIPTGYDLYLDTTDGSTLFAHDVSSPYTLVNALPYSTEHFWTVVAYNGTGDGPAATPFSFTTMADPTVTAFPWTEGFDSVTAPALPAGWTAIDNNGDSDIWITYASNPYSAPNAAAIYTDYNTANDDYLVTPPVVLTGNQRMKFWTRAQSTSEVDELAILLSSTTPTAAAFTIVAMPSFPVNFTAYAEYTVDLSAYSGTHYIAFARKEAPADGWRLYVDNVTIEDIPTAPIFSYAPTAIDFGTVMQNVAATAQNVTVTNTGGGTINLTTANISITGTDAAMFSYVATNLPAALAGGQSVTIPVTVTVTSEGAKTATLTINYNSVNYDVALSATGLPAGIVVIGDGTANNNLPINPFYGYTYSQSIFLQSEINVPDQRIESVYYYWNGVAEAVDSNDWTIYMGHTAATEFASTTDWIPLANLSQVFSGTIALPATAGWIEIPLTAPFIYNNTDNLVIAVDENAPSYDGYDEFFYSTAAATNRSLRYYSDGTNPDPAAPVAGTLVLAYPNVMLELGDIPAGMPDPVVITNPANGTTGLPIDGFDITWTPALTGGVPTYYAVFMSQDETTIYDDLYFETSNTHFNPVTEGMVSFDYLDRWYFTIQAFNAEGDALVEPAFWFEIEDAPQIITTFPWTENFDAALTAPADWTVSDVDGAGTNWVGSTTYSHSAPNAFVHNFSTAVDEPGQNGWLITPAIQVPAGNYYLSWWNYNVWPTYMVYNGVKVNTTNNPTDPNWVEIWSQDAAASAWSQAVVSISAYAGQTVYFAFNYQGYDGDNWYIDDVSVYELTVDTFGPVITHLPVINTPREDIGQYVVADIADDATWNNPIGGANMYYSIDGGTTWSAPVAMTLDVAPTYYALIPPQALGTTVTYKIEAWDSLNNMTTTGNYAFGVNDPTWIWYDQGGTTYLGYTTTDFGPTVMFENPFYGTGNAMQLLATDGSSYYGNAANLQIWTYDGVNDLVPYFTTPIPVTFGAQTYETFDLSTYNVQITTPYFFVSYLDVPMGNYILFDSTYDYGTSYVFQGTTLYTMGNAGSWAIGANVTTGANLALPTPVVSIQSSVDGIALSWDAVDGANSYMVYGSADPYAADPWTNMGTVLTNGYVYNGTDNMKFFKVVATDATPARVASYVISAPSFNLNAPSITLTPAPKTQLRLKNNRK